MTLESLKPITPTQRPSGEVQQGRGGDAEGAETFDDEGYGEGYEPFQEDKEEEGGGAEDGIDISRSPPQSPVGIWQESEHVENGYWREDHCRNPNCIFPRGHPGPCSDELGESQGNQPSQATRGARRAASQAATQE